MQKGEERRRRVDDWGEGVSGGYKWGMGASKMDKWGANEYDSG